MERNRRKMLASVGWDLTGFRHWRSQCHEIDRRSMSVAVIVSCNGWIDFQCVVLKVCGKIMREWLSWWSTTLPRLGSRVQVPSRALKNKKKGYPETDILFLIVRAGPCSPLRSFSLIRKTELWRTNKPPALRVVRICVCIFCRHLPATGEWRAGIRTY